MVTPPNGFMLQEKGQEIIQNFCLENLVPAHAVVSASEAILAYVGTMYVISKNSHVELVSVSLLNMNKVSLASLLTIHFVHHFGCRPTAIVVYSDAYSTVLDLFVDGRLVASKEYPISGFNIFNTITKSQVFFVCFRHSGSQVLPYLSHIVCSF